MEAVVSIVFHYLKMDASNLKFALIDDTNGQIQSKSEPIAVNKVPLRNASPIGIPPTRQA